MEYVAYRVVVAFVPVVVDVVVAVVDVAVTLLRAGGVRGVRSKHSINKRHHLDVASSRYAAQSVEINCGNNNNKTNSHTFTQIYSLYPLPPARSLARQSNQITVRLKSTRPCTPAPAAAAAPSVQFTKEGDGGREREEDRIQ